MRRWSTPRGGTRLPTPIAVCLLAAIGLAVPALAEEADEEPAPAGDARRAAKGDGDFKDFGELEIESLLDVETSVGLRGAVRSQRDTPGTITVVSREEIERLGARDLIDILAMVPGFQFGADSLATHTSAVRGLWAADGRSMLLLDGHDLAELAYNGALLGNRIPIDWLERVEVIRGPASLAYGGGAELTVINLVTRKDPGFHASGAYGQMFHSWVKDQASLADSYARRSLTFQWNQAFPEADGLEAHLAFHVGQGNRSDGFYRDAFPTSPAHVTPMAGQTAADPLMLDLSLVWKGLEVKYLFERYHTTFRDSWSGGIDLSLPADYTTSSLLLTYDWEILADLHLRPSARYVWQKPWETTDERAWDYDEAWWDMTMHRVQLRLPLSWTPLDGGEYLERLTVLAGLEYVYDWAEDKDFLFANPGDPEGDRVPTVELHDLAAYAQVLVDLRWINASAGLRYQWHTRSDHAFAPRVALQKAYGPFHFKALYSQSFRAPPIYDYSTLADVPPEQATAYELELGYQLVDWLQLTLNGFDITIDSPRYYNSAVGDRSKSHVGTRGFELELRFRHQAWLAGLSYSFYDVVGKNNVADYAVPGKKHVLLGMAPHKITAHVGVVLAEHLSLHTSLWVLSDQRYVYTDHLSAAPGSAQRVEELPWQVLWNAYLRYDFPVGLWLGFGLYNILDTGVWYPQGYDAEHPPIPGTSFEAMLRLGYGLEL
jgi:outer membrane receptor for ferrienterochelin and colicins